MIHVIEERNAKDNAQLLREMFKLRASVFRDKLGWDVSVDGAGQEIDRFDSEAPVYIICTNDHGHVDASCRLLPTTGPTLLAEIFSDTAPDAALIESPSIWECTRFCAAAGAPLSASAAVIAAIGQVALKAGVDSVLGNFDATMLRVYRRIGCEVEVLGSTRRFSRPVYLGAFPVSQTRVDLIQARIAQLERATPDLLAAA